MILFLRVLFGTVFAVMVATTTWASLQVNIVAGGAELLRNPWGIATLADAYFGFLTFYVWVAWRERTLAARLVWLVLVLFLGNLAMSAYVLTALFRLERDADLGQLFARRTDS